MSITSVSPMSINSVRCELATAIRQVNASYRALPPEKRPEVRWSVMDDTLDMALKSRDREQALTAVEAWRDHWLGLFGALGAGR